MGCIQHSSHLQQGSFSHLTYWGNCKKSMFWSVVTRQSVVMVTPSRCCQNSFLQHAREYQNKFLELAWTKNWFTSIKEDCKKANSWSIMNKVLIPLIYYCPLLYEENCTKQSLYSLDTHLTCHVFKKKLMYFIVVLAY